MSEDKAEELMAFIAELEADDAQKNGHANGHAGNRIQSFDSPRAVIDRAAKYISKMPIAVDEIGRASCRERVSSPV